MCYIMFVNEFKNLFNINDNVGIVGYGNIGKKLKLVLDTFSIRNSVYDPFLDHDFLSNINTIKECDLISLHVPLTHKTLFPTFKCPEIPACPPIITLFPKIELPANPTWPAIIQFSPILTL